MHVLVIQLPPLAAAAPSVPNSVSSDSNVVIPGTNLKHAPGCPLCVKTAIPDESSSSPSMMSQDDGDDDDDEFITPKNSFF